MIAKDQIEIKNMENVSLGLKLKIMKAKGSEISLEVEDRTFRRKYKQ